jgi:cobalt-zinc-cadmium efflux system outer membrane protein
MEGLDGNVFAHESLRRRDLRHCIGYRLRIGASTPTGDARSIESEPRGDVMDLRHVAKLTVASFLLLGCGSVIKERGHEDVAKIVQERTGYRTRWEKGPPTDRQVSDWVGALLAKGLTRDTAVEIALVNNPTLQMTYEDLGVSQADMVQAGLLSNPTLSGSIGFPLNGGKRLEYETSLAQNFLDIFALPLRKRIARDQFNAEILRVAHETMQVTTDVRKMLARLQGQSRIVELRRTIVEGARLAADLARRQHDAGNIDDFSLTQEMATWERAALELEQDELDLFEAREALNRMLGLWGPRTAWNLAEPLPDIPASEPAPDHLESRAIASRLDVRAAKKQSLLFWNALELAKSTRYFGFVEVGIHAHQDPDGPVLMGPTLSLELPIFDQRQALIARLEAQYRQTEHKLARVAIDARSEVRTAAARLAAARRTVDRYKKDLLPLREQAVEQAQLLYNGMQIGLYQLLAAKQEQVESYRSYIDAVRDYWSARADLEMAVGGRIDAPMQLQESSKG